MVHGGLLTHPSQIMYEAIKALDDYQSLHRTPVNEGRLTNGAEVERWKPPPANMIKINWDAALDAHRGVVGLGIIARNDCGRVLGAYGVTKRVEVSPTGAEALAALHAMIFAQKKEFRGVIFEGDALNIVGAMNSHLPCDSSYGHFVADVKTGLASMSNSRFVHVNREANLAAHSLAKAACNLVICSIIWHCTPSSIDGIIRKDAFALSK